MRGLLRLAGLALVMSSLGLWLIPVGKAFAQAGSGEPLAVVLTAKEAVTPVMVEYLDRGFTEAKERQAGLIIVQLDTPGGSVDEMEKIVKLFRSSDIPVVVYVTPANAMAASAGTIITLAGHVSAMTPDTTIGAASPVGSQGEDIGQTMESKVKEVLKAMVRNLAKDRPAGAIKLAEDTIEYAKAVTDREALAAGLVDLRATSTADLLVQLNGREVKLAERKVILNTQGMALYEVKNTIMENLLAFLINPNLVFLLLAVGVQAILIELSSPGGWVAGFIGVICLILAVYGLGLLPVNWFGILFLILAFVLFVMDIKAAAHGTLTLAGAGSFIAGALVLFNSVRTPGIPPVSVPLVVGTGLILAASFFAILTLALKAQRRPVLVGREVLTGQVGYARSDLQPRGMVHIGGEEWGAELVDGEDPILEGERVEVVSVEGLKLRVRRPQQR